MEKKGAEIVVETLIEQGCDTVFGYPGGTVIDIYDALYNNSDRIRHVLTCHEQGAAHAADGYARASGKVGVVIATSGPGATNLVTGIATAFFDSTPMVAITGNVALDLIGRDSFQEVDIMGVTMPVTKHNFMVRDVAHLAGILREAFQIATSGRPGPVLVDIPKNVQAAISDFESLQAPPTAPPTIPADHLRQDEIAQAIQMIAASERPFIYTGGGVVIAEAAEELQAFAKKLNCPIGATIMGITALPWNFENFTGMMGMHGEYASSWAVSKADLIIAVGTRFSDRVTGNKKEFGKRAQILHIDIDHAEIGKNIAVDGSLIGNIKEVLAALTAALPQKNCDAWNAEVAKIKQESANNPAPDQTQLRPWDIIRAVRKKAAPDTPIVTDVGQHQMWTAQYYPFSTPRTFITSGGLGTMGFGMGAAIGAQHSTGKQTILITGDGSFHMNMNELVTMVSNELPIVVIIMNNGALGMVKQWQNLFYDQRFSNTLPGRKTDYVKLAEALGAKGFRVTKPSEMDAVMDEAFAAGGPAVIDCQIDPGEAVLPMIPPGGSIKDIIMRD